MNPQKSNAKDFFLNLGATIALYTSVASLINLLFTIINKAYPQIVNGYSYYGSGGISWPVAILIIFFPIFILLMWIMEKDYIVNPDRQNAGIHKWLTWLTIFLAGLTLAGGLITTLYYFIDGQELTLGFLLKVLALLVISGAVFIYYLTDVRGKLTSGGRKVWRVVALLIVVGSIVWGFTVLGSPRTQRLYKYDEAKVNDLMNINQYVISYYQSHGGLPGKLSDLNGENGYFTLPLDGQSGKSYEYVLVGQSAKAYQLCAEFNKAINDNSRNAAAYPYGVTSWNHGAGHYCFSQTINPAQYPPVKY